MNPTPKPPAQVIAIDGPASSGKGTVARLVAEKLGYDHIDTGAMYRSVALFALEQQVTWDDEAQATRVAEALQFSFPVLDGTPHVIVNDRDVSTLIRGEHIGQGASQVAALPGVRRALLEAQRALGKRGRIVMDGRDIGTVVLPEADLKVYLDASTEERARRRFAESRGLSFEQVLSALKERDDRDMNRPIAPLKPAADAVIVDTTRLSIEQAVAHICTLAGA